MEQTQHLPRATVEDLYAADRPCPICAEVKLTVTHLDELPDYVKCSKCDSVFVLDRNSELVMFGSISSDYPETSRHALKRWMTIEAVQTVAAQERSPVSETPGKQPTPPIGAGEDDKKLPASVEQVERRQDQLPPDREPAEQEDYIAPTEPEPGQRYRVIVSGEPDFPDQRCAHCFRTPAARRILATGDFEPPRGFEIPVCTVCYSRATARTPEERNARLVAHLSSILVGAVLFVFTIALARLGANLEMFLSIGVGTAVGALGWGTTALLTLSRLPRFQPSDDARYVLSTALIQYRKREDGLAFSWRNPRYAEQFFGANQGQAVGEITKVFESGRMSPPPVTKR